MIHHGNLPIIVLIPVYNDWEPLKKLIVQLNAQFQDTIYTPLHFLVIDDGSFENRNILLPTDRYEIIHLHRNLGHQKALSIGLAYIQQHLPCAAVLIMDGDGEDRPEDAIELLNAWKGSDKIIFASREKRQEGILYQIFYFTYKNLFRLLTGQKIAYGNFLVIPRSALDKLVYYSEIWNHIPGGILKSGLPFHTVPTKKGNRFSGQSKMTFHSLILHGLGAISVFMDTIASKLLMFSIALTVLSVAGIVTIILIKGFTQMAIPGWASTIASLCLVVFLQCFLLSLFTLFLYLSAQSQRKFIPALHFAEYIASTEKSATDGN
jgi:polyisoprenyl-phosphate glycosyltransferase